MHLPIYRTAPLALTLVAFSLMALPVMAQESDAAASAASPADLSPLDNVQGRLGLGYFTGAAPLGVRYWLSRDIGIDAGVDFAMTSGTLDALRWGLDVGGVMALSHYHYSVVFARAGLGIRSVKATGRNGKPGETNINANVFLGAELFLGALGFPNVSLQGGYGLQAEWTVAGGTELTIGAANAGLNLVSAGTLGFHIYL